MVCSAPPSQFSSPTSKVLRREGSGNLFRPRTTEMFRAPSCQQERRQQLRLRSAHDRFDGAYGSYFNEVRTHLTQEGIRLAIGLSSGLASSLLSRFLVDFIANIAGRSSRQAQGGHTGAASGFSAGRSSLHRRYSAFPALRIPYPISRSHARPLAVCRRRARMASGDTDAGSKRRRLRRAARPPAARAAEVEVPVLPVERSPTSEKLLGATRSGFSLARFLCPGPWDEYPIHIVSVRTAPSVSTLG